jgi:hypothetical protein
MRASALVVLLLSAVASSPAHGADAPAGPPAALDPYDAPGPDAPPPPPVAKPALPVPPRAPQVRDAEKPSAWQPPRAEVGPLVRESRPREPSDGGLVVVESLVAIVMATGSVVVAAENNAWLILAGPLATGGLVCGVGHLSESFDGSCAAAIGGAYFGSLLTFPMAWLLAGRSGGEADFDVGLLVGGLLGYVAGTTIGAVVGWNMSRTPRDRPTVDVARLDALAASRGTPWREPLLPRGALLEAGAPRLTTPVLAFRF